MAVSGFTRTLWEVNEALLQEVFDHSFLHELSTGELPADAFRFYVVQDALFLRDFARALALAAAKTPEEDWAILFSDHAANALRVERSLHDSFFTEIGLSKRQVERTPLAPTNLAYTSYLLRVAWGEPFHQILGAVLPCYWIYREVGKRLLERGSPNGLYRRWIDTYGGEVFGEVVEGVLKVTDQVSADLNFHERVRLSKHFTTTCKYEWMFWQMAYHLEEWPV